MEHKNSLDNVAGMSYTEVAGIIQEWIIGRNAERDREILRY